MHRSIPASLAFGMALLAIGCKKTEEAPAVIEEAPAAAVPVETDTSATLMEEPDLQAVGQKGKPAKGAPAASPSAEAAGLSDRGSYVVQVSVFKSARQASGLVEKLAAQGFPAYVAEVQDPTPELSGTYHRVRIGRFQKMADAKAFGEGTLRPAGYDFWVDNKKNDAVGGTGYSSGDSYSSPSSSSTSSYSTPASAPVEEISAPAEPSAPASSSWGTPSEPAAATSEPSAPSGEPAAPAGDAWGAPKDPAQPGTSDSPASSAADTGKVNLDEW